MRRLIGALAVGLLVAGCAAPSSTVRDDGAIEDRAEADRLAQDIDEAQTTLAAHLEEPRCDDACGLSERICSLTDRICALHERRPTDAEIEDRCRTATGSCERAATRVSEACECGDGAS